MSSYKNVNNNYTLTCNNGNGLFTVNAITSFTKDVTFQGNVTYDVPATTVAAFFTAAANNTGSITAMGLLGQTGPSSFAGLKFDSIVNAWQTSPSVFANGAPITAYANIGDPIPAGANTNIQFNNNGIFGGDSGLTYNVTSKQIRINGSQVFGNIGSIPTNIANAVVMYSNTVGQGGTGLYFKSSAAADELVSRRNAIIYGIIF
jgi:hypothetical protein